MKAEILGTRVSKELAEKMLKGEVIHGELPGIPKIEIVEIDRFIGKPRYVKIRIFFVNPETQDIILVTDPVTLSVGDTITIANLTSISIIIRNPEIP